MSNLVFGLCSSGTVKKKPDGAPGNSPGSWGALVKNTAPSWHMGRSHQQPLVCPEASWQPDGQCHSNRRDSQGSPKPLLKVNTTKNKQICACALAHTHTHFLSDRLFKDIHLHAVLREKEPTWFSSIQNGNVRKRHGILGFVTVHVWAETHCLDFLCISPEVSR